MIRGLYLSYRITTSWLSAIIVLACLAFALAFSEGDWGLFWFVLLRGSPIALLIGGLVGGAAALIGWPIFQRVYGRMTRGGQPAVSAAILAAYSVLTVAAVITSILFLTTDGAGSITIFGLLPAACLTPTIIRQLWTPISMTEEHAR